MEAFSRMRAQVDVVSERDGSNEDGDLDEKDYRKKHLSNDASDEVTRRCAVGIVGA